MKNLQTYLKTIEQRSRMLTPELVELQVQLEKILEKTINEAGVITPGYFSNFIAPLEVFRTNKIISKYHITEEGFSDYVNGRDIKIPVVDVYSKDNSYSTRIFVVPKSFVDAYLK